MKHIPYLTIALTNACNFDCNYCPSFEGGHGEGFNTANKRTDIKLIKEVITIAARLGIDKIRYTGGEPLLVPGLNELMYHSTSLGLHTAVSTNGSMLHKYWGIFEELRQDGNPIDLRISLDTLEERLSAQTWRVPVAVVQKTMENISEAADRRLLNRVGMVVCHENQSEVESIISYCSALRIDLKLLDLYNTDATKEAEWRNQFYPLHLVVKRLEPIIESRRQLEYTTSFGIPVEEITLITGIKVRVKDSTKGTRYQNSICTLCHSFPCQEGLYTPLLSTDSRLIPCRLVREEGKLRLTGENIVEQLTAVIELYKTSYLSTLFWDPLEVAA